MPKMTGARCIAEIFKGYDVTHVFFMQSMLKTALIEMGKLNIHRILAHSEKSAAYMADGYARASHKPGICLAQSVGAANLAAGLQDAYLGLSPVIALTGQRAPLPKLRHAYQEIEHAPLFEPVTKFNAAVDRVEDLPFFLRQAFREATAGPPAPVHLDLQGGNTGKKLAEAEADLDVTAEKQFSRYPAFRPEPEMERIREAVRMLGQSLRPVIVAGGGVTASQAGKDVVELAEKLSIPVVTSLNGKGTILENHSLSVGVVGSYSRWCANRVVSEADLVLFIGSHTGSQVTNEWRIPRIGTLVIQIDIDPLELGSSYPAKVALLGDARTTVRRLIEAVEPVKPAMDWLQRVHQLVSEWRHEAETMLNSDASPIRPERICKELTEFLPSDGLVVSCTGHSGVWTGTMLDLTQPGQSYLRAAGSLGWAFPAALGVKCAVPERPVICFTGDGGLWYHIAELETAIRHGINIVTVVNNNHSLNQVTWDMVDKSEAGEIWQFSDVNLATLAETMGCFGIQVRKPSELKGALQAAFASGKPAVVDVVSDIDAMPLSPWAP
ncbi:thiamine pyrophosphate-binding protein [Chloroflexota bacterium]